MIGQGQYRMHHWRPDKSWRRLVRHEIDCGNPIFSANEDLSDCAIHEGVIK